MQNQSVDFKELPLWRKIAAIMVLVIGLPLVTCTSMCGKSEKSTTSAPVEEVAQEQPAESADAPDPEPEQQELVLYDGDTMRVVYKDWREESIVSGCCYLYLSVENKTNAEVWFHDAYGTSSVNGYNGMFMQGLPTYVQPGNKAVMGLIMTYQQFGVSSFDEVHTCEFELVQEDKNNLGTEYARALIRLER